MWLAILENEDGTWNDDPIGAETKEQAIELAKKQWPTVSKKRFGEMICLYECRFKEEIEVPETPEEMEQPLSAETPDG